MDENKQKLSSMTQLVYNLSKVRRNSSDHNSDLDTNLLTRRQDDALCTVNSLEQSAGEKDSGSCQEESSYASSTVLIGNNFGGKNGVRLIKLPEVPKLPPYTTWIFLDRYICTTLGQLYMCSPIYIHVQEPCFNMCKPEIAQTLTCSLFHTNQCCSLISTRMNIHMCKMIYTKLCFKWLSSSFMLPIGIVYGCMEYEFLFCCCWLNISKLRFYVTWLKYCEAASHAITAATLLALCCRFSSL